MTQQFAFCFDLAPEMPCAFGNLRDPLERHHCEACREELERGCVAFAAAVAAGQFDERGFTPAELRHRKGRH